MKQLKLIVSLWALLTSALVWAQQPLVLQLPDTLVATNDTLRLDITTRQFTNLVSLQFSMKWDTAVLRYARFEQKDLPFAALGTNGAASGVLRFSWFDIEGKGQTLADGKSIVRLIFFVKGNPGTFTEVNFTDTPLEIQVFRATTGGSFEETSLNAENGLVTIAGGMGVLRANLGITNVRCAGGNDGAINAILQNAPAGSTIRWRGPNNFQSQQEDISNLSAGTYTLEILGNGGTILLDTTLTLTQPATAVAINSIQTDSTNCSGSTGSATATASGGIAPYSYSLGNTFVPNNQFTNLAAGRYTLTVRDSNNCTVSDSFNIIASDSQILIDTIATSSTTCAASTGSATITVSGGNAPYTYSLGNNFVNTNQFNNLAAGRYILTIRDANNCTVSDSFNIITSDSQILIDTIAAVSTTCSGTTGSATVTASGGNAPYTYSLGTTFVTNNQFTNLAAGRYTLTVRDANNCSKSDTFSILSSEAQVLIDTIITIPSGCTQATGTATVTTSGGTAPYTYSIGNNFVNVNQFSNLATGPYTLTIRDANNCSTSDTFSIIAANAPQVELGDTVFICQGENTMLDAGLQTTYRWSNGATTQSITISQPGAFSVTVTNPAGCSASDTVQVQAGNAFSLEIENDTLSVCPQASLQLRATTAETYQWIDTSKTLSKLDIANPVAEPLFTSRYTVIASNGCNADTASVEIQVLETTATAGPDTCIAPGDVLELYASGGDAYFWFLTEYSVSNPRIANPTTEPEDSTTYFVMITDINGCKILDTLNVMVANNPLDITAVNLITPNGDGKNDALEFKGITKYGINTLKIFNRWGDLVYQKINYQKDDERFDGTRNGKLLPAGNYFYVLSFQTGDLKQTLTILRN